MRSLLWSSLLLFLGLLGAAVAAAAMESKLLAPSHGLTPRPMCGSQYALANYACSLIPYSPLPPPAPPGPSQESHHHHHRSSNSSGHSRHHHRSPRHDDEHRGTPEEEDCCRWLYEMDNDCVCEMLIRLPDFLSRPVHEYTVTVGDSCNVTYACGGRVIRK